MEENKHINHNPNHKPKLTRAERIRRKKIMRLRRKLHFYGWRSVVVLAVLFIAVHLINHYTLTLNIADGETETVQYGSAPVEVTATYQGRIFKRSGVEAAVTVEGDTDYSTIGTHTATYTASYGLKKVKATRTVEVTDTEGPVITLNYKDGYYASKDDGYVEEGYTAVDNYDGDVTASVQVSEEEDGKITYSATDSHGNESSVVRTINYGDKIVYLTFDDGPGKYTDQLLDTLEKYDVKVTFFTTNQFSKYIDCIKREAEEGHTVAIHSYTHDFKTIYSGVDDFYDDIQKMADVIKEQTGDTPTLLRFPGGSGNSVSRKYCTGVITDIIAEMPEKGYQYVDWNVNSGDAEGITDPDEIAQNIISGIQKHDISIVLQHDIKEGSVNAVSQVIEWGQENGYTFLPLTDNSYLYHGKTIRN